MDRLLRVLLQKLIRTGNLTDYDRARIHVHLW